jgi:hypothetical protein
MVTHVRRVGAYVAAGALVVGLVLPSGALHAGLGGDSLTKKAGNRNAWAIGMVEFDCTMVAVDPTSVISCVVTGETPGRIWDIRWETGSVGLDAKRKYIITFVYNPHIRTAIRVYADRARSANNGVRLDGDKRNENGDDHQCVMLP